MYIGFAVFYLDKSENFREKSFMSCQAALKFAGTLIKEHGDIFHKIYYIEYGESENYTYTKDNLKTLMINSKVFDATTLMELYL